MYTLYFSPLEFWAYINLKILNTLLQSWRCKMTLSYYGLWEVKKSRGLLSLDCLIQNFPNLTSNPAIFLFVFCFCGCCFGNPQLHPEERTLRIPSNGNPKEPRGQGRRGHLTRSPKTRDLQQKFYAAIIVVKTIIKYVI